MGKKTTGKKNKNDETDADSLEEEVINSRIGHEVSDDDVESRVTPNEVVAEGDVDVERQKKNKKKKRDEIRGDDVELSAISKNEVAIKDGKKRKIKEGNEDAGSDSGLRDGRIEDLVETNAGEAKSKKKEKKKEEEEEGKLLEDSVNGAESSVNQSKAVIDSDVLVHKEKKKKKKSKKRQEVSCDDDECGSTLNETVAEGDVDMNTENENDRKEKKKKKKKRKLEINEDETVEEGDVDMNTENEKDGKKKRKLGINEDENETLKAKKNEDERINNEDEVNGVLNRGSEHHFGLEENTSLHKQKNDLEEQGKKDKKKAMSMEKLSGSDKKASRTKKGVKSNGPSESSAKKERPKKVSFSDHVQVFPSSDAKNGKDDGFIRGKRFSLEEDEMIKKAVINYIEAHRLGEDGLNMVLHCRSHPEVKYCWKEIGAALPWRPCESIYYRAHILFERDENCKWTPEELELVRKFHEQHGSDWKMMADALGKHRFHVKDAWRRIKLPNQKKGQWSQEEYQKLFDLVNMDLRMKASEEKKTKHGMLRDNISWEAISEKLSTRTNAICCMKWYDQLTSPMVAEGKWTDTDDFHLVNALSSLDACCMDDVDWENLLEHRCGTICRKRWNQMVKHLGTDGNKSKSFPEQVEILSMRYCLDVLEARLAYNSNGSTL